MLATDRLYFTGASTYQYYAPMPPTPLPGDVGKEVGIWIMQNSNALPVLGMLHAPLLSMMPVSQIPTLCPPKRWGFTRGFAC